MRFIGNILWLIFGGLWTSICYLIGSLCLMITIVGIPFGLQTLKLAVLALWPFGRVISEKEGGMGCLGIIMNIFWIIFGGIETCISHLVWGVICCITIVGIPFGKQHFKLASLALIPFGRKIEKK